MATVVGEEAAPAVAVEVQAPEKAAEVKEAPKPEEGQGKVEDQGKKADEGDQKAEKKPRKRKPKSAGPHHPPYFEMIKEAILAQAADGRSGSSTYAIAKHMGENHRAVLPANYRKVLAVQLRNFAAKGRLVKVKASFKLAPAEEKTAAATAAKRKKTPAVTAPAKRKRTADKKKPSAAPVPAPKEARKARAKRARKAAPAPAHALKPRQHRAVRAAGTRRANKASA
jgi:histone H1/5